MPRPAAKLRTILTYATVVGGGLALVAASALVLVTSLLHRTTVHLAASAESVRLAQSAQLDLLVHSRADDPLVRARIEGQILGRLEQAEDLVTQGRTEYQEALERTDAYLRAAEAGPRASAAELNSAFTALERLAGANLEQAREESERATQIDRIANTLGVAVGLLLVLAAGLLLWWLNVPALRPVLELASAMERFGRGDRRVRAPETGPAELREMAARFNQMAAALAAQREAQLAFVAGVAHDLRNPLAALRLSLGGIAPHKPLPPEPRLRSLLEVVNRQITRLERMTGDFVDRAKIESGQLELKLQRRDLRALLREVVEVFAPASPNHQLRLTLPDSVVVLECDPLRIEQVVTNLVSNATKYSPEGGPVDVRLDDEGDEAVISVSDRGIGIAPEEQATLFEPFRRAGVSDRFPGTGIGLFVVRRIVEAHQGRIEVESTPGEGSTFRVFLPKLRLHAVPGPPAPGAQPTAH